VGKELKVPRSAIGMTHKRLVIAPRLSRPDSGSAFVLPPSTFTYAPTASSSKGEVETYAMAPIAGPSRSDNTFHDYTEGASPLDIQAAAATSRRSRRDSQYSAWSEEGSGEMFSGPGHAVNPSSVSRMSHIETGRRSGEWSRARRKSMDSTGAKLERKRSRASTDAVSIEGEDSADDASRSLLHRRVESPPESPTQRTSVFGTLTGYFIRQGTSESVPRRKSLSQRSFTSSRRSRRRSRSRGSLVSEDAVASDEDYDERWGYSSGEEDESDDGETRSMLIQDTSSVNSSMNYDSEPEYAGVSQSLPLLASDPIFGGETHIDIEMPFEELDPPPAGPPSRQTIHIADEDTSIRFVGYEVVTWRQWIWRLACITTAGLLALLGHWFPRLWLRWVAREKAFKDIDGGFVVVEVFEVFLRA
jgi:cation-transporting P-type ATPase 13A2